MVSIENVFTTLSEMFDARGYDTSEMPEVSRNVQFVVSGVLVVITDASSIGLKFVAQFKEPHVIIVSESKWSSYVDKKIEQLRVARQDTIELFTWLELNTNITKHIYAAKHEITPQQQADKIIKFYKTYTLPKISITDPFVKYIGAKIGDLIKITRRNGSITYRMCE